MKKPIIFTILLVFVFSLSIQAQDYSRLQNIANNIEREANSLVNQTARSLSRNRNNSSADIRNLFLAQQLSVSAKLMRQMISERYNVNDLRTAENSLSTLARSLPSGRGWQNVQNSIRQLDGELRRGGFGNNRNNRNNDIYNNDDNYNNNDNFGNNNITGSATWNGRVDNVVQIAVRGRRIQSKTVAGATYPPGRYTFNGNLPLRGNVSIGVNKRDGRGDVRIVQQPSRLNNYTAIIEIRDSDGGADNYSLEIYWN
ncbi:MAG: hypothetical protein M3405_01720 [Acidobacteriota bacterium]|jgi:hypothetical protein|nr:hypothetical protein [Acidobacteriota bacterium]